MKQRCLPHFMPEMRESLAMPVELLKHIFRVEPRLVPVILRESSVNQMKTNEVQTFRRSQSYGFEPLSSALDRKGKK